MPMPYQYQYRTTGFPCQRPRRSSLAMQTDCKYMTKKNGYYVPDWETKEREMEGEGMCVEVDVAVIERRFGVFELSQVII